MFRRNSCVGIDCEDVPKLVEGWYELLGAKAFTERDRKAISAHYSACRNVGVSVQGVAKRKLAPRGPRADNALKKFDRAVNKMLDSSISAGVFVDDRQLSNSSFESRLLAPVRSRIEYPLFFRFSTNGTGLHNANNEPVKSYLDSRVKILSSMVSELHTYDTNRRFSEAGIVAFATATAAAVTRCFVTTDRAVIEGVGNAVADLPQDIMNGIGGLRSPDKDVKKAAPAQLLIGGTSMLVGYVLPSIGSGSQAYGVSLGAGAAAGTLMDAVILASYFYKSSKKKDAKAFYHSLEKVWNLPSYRGQLIGSVLQLAGATIPRAFGYSPDPVIESAYIGPLDVVCGAVNSNIQHYKQKQKIQNRLLEGLY